MSAKVMMTSYTPGVCNINDTEASFRLRGGHFFAVVGSLLFISLIGTGAHPIFGLTVAVPVAIAALQYLQVFNRFCVRFGLQSKHSVGDLRQTSKVQHLASKKLDSSRSWVLIIQALLIGLLVSIVSVLLLKVA